MKKKLQKPCLTCHNLLMAQDLWEAHYQTFLIILLKEFIKLNRNMDAMIKNVNRVRLKAKIVSAVLNT